MYNFKAFLVEIFLYSYNFLKKSFCTCTTIFLKQMILLENLFINLFSGAHNYWLIGHPSYLLLVGHQVIIIVPFDHVNK